MGDSSTKELNEPPIQPLGPSERVAIGVAALGFSGYGLFEAYRDTNFFDHSDAALVIFVLIFFGCIGLYAIFAPRFKSWLPKVQPAHIPFYRFIVYAVCVLIIAFIGETMLRNHALKNSEVALGTQTTTIPGPLPSTTPPHIIQGPKHRVIPVAVEASTEMAWGHHRATLAPIVATARPSPVQTTALKQFSSPIQTPPWQTPRPSPTITNGPGSINAPNQLGNQVNNSGSIGTVNQNTLRQSKFLAQLQPFYSRGQIIEQELGSPDLTDAEIDKADKEAGKWAYDTASWIEMNMDAAAVAKFQNTAGQFSYSYDVPPGAHITERSKRDAIMNGVQHRLNNVESIMNSVIFDPQ